jgi:hypothetical protein
MDRRLAFLVLVLSVAVVGALLAVAWAPVAGPPPDGESGPVEDPVDDGSILPGS